MLMQNWKLHHIHIQTHMHTHLQMLTQKRTCRQFFIRVNQIGYVPNELKRAVLMGTVAVDAKSYQFHICKESGK